MLSMLRVVVLGFVLSYSLAAQALTDDVAALVKEWDHIKYELPDSDARAKGFEALAAKAAAVAEQYPQQAGPRIWQAISLASQAGEDGGLSALSYVKQSKKLLEQALALHPNEEETLSIYVSLGSLYYQVPGWPIGFGDEDEAEVYLNKALALSADDLEANFWMADYLIEEKKAYAEAAKHLQKCLSAPARAHREIADKGRKAEAAAKLAKLKTKLH